MQLTLGSYYLFIAVRFLQQVAIQGQVACACYAESALAGPAKYPEQNRDGLYAAWHIAQCCCRMRPQALS